MTRKKCRHGRVKGSDASGATILCNCCDNSLRLVDEELVRGCKPRLAGLCRRCYS